VRDLVVETNLELVLSLASLPLEEPSSLARPSIPLSSHTSRARKNLSDDLIRSLHLFRGLLDFFPLLLPGDSLERIRGEFRRHGGVGCGSFGRLGRVVAFAFGGEAEGLEDRVSDGVGQGLEVRSALRTRAEGKGQSVEGARRERRRKRLTFLYDS
jgi:hypothetical protein